ACYRLPATSPTAISRRHGTALRSSSSPAATATPAPVRRCAAARAVADRRAYGQNAEHRLNDRTFVPGHAPPRRSHAIANGATFQRADRRRRLALLMLRQRAVGCSGLRKSERRGARDMTYDAYGTGAGHWSDRRPRVAGGGSRRGPGRADAGRRGTDRSAPTRFGGAR